MTPGIEVLMHAGIYPEVPDDFGHWLAGFIDGEGCFYIRGPSPGDSNPKRLACRFALRLRRDDRPVLEEIQRRTGIGRIWDIAAMRQRADGYLRSPQSTWTVDRKAECCALVEILDRFPLRARKAGDYMIWREAVLWHAREGKRNGQSLGPRDWTPLLELNTALRARREFHAASSSVSVSSRK